LDVGTPTAPVEVGAASFPGYAYDVEVTGGHAYVAASGTGLRVIDIGDPASVFEVGFLNPGAWSIQ